MQFVIYVYIDNIRYRVYLHIVQIPLQQNYMQILKYFNAMLQPARVQIIGVQIRKYS